MITMFSLLGVVIILVIGLGLVWGIFTVCPILGIILIFPAIDFIVIKMLLKRGKKKGGEERRYVPCRKKWYKNKK